MSERVHDNYHYPLPKPLYYTTLATLSLSIPVLVLAFMDLGTVSFFFNIPASGLTILHDATLLRMARRHHRHQPRLLGIVTSTPKYDYEYFDPVASGFNLCVLIVCSVLYFIGFGMTIFTAVFAERGDISWETGTGMGTIVAQAAFGPIVGALLLLALRYSIHMRKLGGHRHPYGQF
ncbi:hypothetical protein B0F90DRAFT_1732790 [Multifurca ochricompacta]|uniref:Uncharacterized protein n=1 Tax=Multifurca ochricompacta TaxID=376703 RepID=A0AAD4M3R2_9AGAM|nr:hypothetical protein B0F90DRAFT_1732790 [Multifurca ochricompacta]